MSKRKVGSVEPASEPNKMIKRLRRLRASPRSRIVATLLWLGGIALVCLGAYSGKKIEAFIGFAGVLCGFMVSIISGSRTVTINDPYPFGIDCVWLASDRNGHVGAFVTADGAPFQSAY